MKDDKPIAERLREWAYEACPINKAMSVYDIDLCSFDDEARELFNAIACEIEKEQRAIIEAQEEGAHLIIKAYADEHGMPMQEDETITEWLDRWFIKRPVFEDGEPVQWGDEVELHFEDERDGIMSGTFTGYQCFGTCTDIIEIHNVGEREMASVIDIKAIKRKTPKAIASDGKEIVKGERLWVVETPAMNGIVDRFTCKGSEVVGVHIKMDGGSAFFYKPEELTHEPTVFDADMKPINVGDVVWHVDGNCHPWKVTGIEESGVLVEDTVYSDGPVCFAGRYLTHREPDSRDKVKSEIPAEILNRIDDLVKQGRWIND